MSLQVWLPLNRDLRNNGLVNMNITSSNIAFVNSALSTGNIIMDAETTNQVLNNDAVSIAFWMYVNAESGSTTQRSMIFGNDNNMVAPNNRRFSLFQYPTCNDLHWSWQNYDSNDAKIGGLVSSFFPSYEWVHCVITYNREKREVIIYKNGEQVQKQTWVYQFNSPTYAFDTTIIHSNSYRYIYDFRIYDHALSLKEVKELAKGLYLHYTFDDPYIESTVNIDPCRMDIQSNKSYPTGGVQREGVTWQLVDFDGFKCYKLTMNKQNITSQWGVYINSNPLSCGASIGDTVTRSMMLYVPSGQTLPVWFNESIEGSQTGKSFIQYDYNHPDTWQLVSMTGTIVNNSTNNYLHYFSAQSSGSINNFVCYMRDFQMEIKDHATPYTPNYRINPGNLYYGKNNMNFNASGTVWYRSRTNDTPLPTIDSDGNIVLYGYETTGNHQSYIAHSGGLINVKPNTSYTISVITKPSATSATFRIYFYQKAEDGTSITNNMQIFTPTSAEVGTWVKRSLTITTTANTYKIYTELNCYNNPADTTITLKNYSIELVENNITNTIIDNSGFGNDGNIYGDLHIFNNSIRGSYSTKVNNTIVSGYAPDLDNCMISFGAWFKFDFNEIKTYLESLTSITDVRHTPGGNLFGNSTTGSYGGIGICWNSNKMYPDNIFSKLYYRASIRNTTNTNPTTSAYEVEFGRWTHIFVTYDSSNKVMKLYKNGALLYTVSNTPSTFTIRNLVINYATVYSGNGPGTSIPFYISDTKVYKKVLTDTEILDLYKSTFIIDDTQKSYCYELNESDSTSQVKLTEAGIAKCKNFSESITSVFDDTEYIEPDGSVWIRIFHHNNPANALFSSSDSFVTNVYKDADRWFNVSICNKASKWELMVKECAQSNSTVHKYRWIQNANPMLATHDQVKTTEISPITTSGYSNITTYGGLELMNTTTCYICQRNDAATSWWGAIGRTALYSGGIEGFVGSGGQYVVTTGYLDLYLRIDNLDETTDTKIIENGSLTANEIMEL